MGVMVGAIGALISGLLFGLGLILSGMANPAKVLDFLDVTGTWDPSLAFVMAGAIGVAAPGFWLVRRRSAPLTGPVFHVPPADAPVDRKLLVGAAVFGIGWGLAGFCPGPALVALALAAPGTLAFVAAMVAAIAAGALLQTRR
ncbi:MAG: YeeE/YedE family protein [Hyphomicrobiaceae bacterium]|nr:YeeE/YedE family protein [Hyphomicrobiaceae bacterium]